MAGGLADEFTLKVCHSTVAVPFNMVPGIQCGCSTPFDTVTGLAVFSVSCAFLKAFFLSHALLVVSAGQDNGLGGVPGPKYCVLACEQWNRWVCVSSGIGGSCGKGANRIIDLGRASTSRA